MIDVIEVIEQGPKGDKGDQGDVGPAGPAGTFDQSLNTTDSVAFSSVTAPIFDLELNQNGFEVFSGSAFIRGASGDAELNTEDLTAFRSFFFPDQSGHLALTENTATAAQGALADTAVQPNTSAELTSLRLNGAASALGLLEVGQTTSGYIPHVKIDNAVRLRGTAAGSYYSALSAGGLTGDRSITFPDATGTIALTSSTWAASAITSGTLDTARLGSGTASSGTWLRGDSTWQALPAAGTKTYYRATPRDNQPPASGFATLDTRNSIAVLDFDDASTESAVFVGVMPEGAVVSSGLIVALKWMATTATSGNVRWSVDFERCTTDLDADSFDTATAATATTNGTSGIVTSTSITCTTIDSIVAGDLFRVRVQRVGGNAADTMSGDAELVAVEVRSAA